MALRGTVADLAGLGEWLDLTLKVFFNLNNPVILLLLLHSAHYGPRHTMVNYLRQAQLFIMD